MFRVRPEEVVNAYKATGLIPVRKMWTTCDNRGGCAFEAVARQITSYSGEEMANAWFDPAYVIGFIDGWDADDPETLLADTGDTREGYLLGFSDAIACAAAVTREFTSIAIISSM